MPNYAPFPCVIPGGFKDKASASWVTVPNGECRVRLMPSGPVTVYPIVQQGDGSYQAGTLASPIVLDGVGTWRCEYHSPVIGDLVTPTFTEIEVVSDGFPAGSSSLPATSPWTGNPFGAWQVTTTDATPTLLVRIPLAADQAVYTGLQIFARTLSTGDSAEFDGLGMIRRLGSASPTGNPDTGIWWVGPILSVATSPYTLQYQHTHPSLVATTCYAFVNADSVDFFVVGLAGTTIKWGMRSPAWTYL